MTTDNRSSLRGRTLGQLLFASRWLQAPLYVGLIVAQGAYVCNFMLELWHLLDVTFSGGLPAGEREKVIMLTVLGLVDVVMIANLLIMVIVGGYETFVSRVRIDGHPDEPEWLSHVNANVLKVKLATAIIGISSVHLLQTFINAAKVPPQTMMWQTIIHLAFVASAIALALIDRIMTPPGGHGHAQPHRAPAERPRSSGAEPELASH
ncbi:TIGR00645 family protein [Bailinhaonella thermotolerans]|uniref:UPF0114 protein D5H75_21025 n=1 Tax=Bailinhaonella thermotolerans TaxID=1070861 RepID=A0A3A4B018_9ACTN|nr:TIGR00645 family protein [Bailinhaonella thermotolerans]RJL30800.1 TIGR00645 family protein [Bailinhaonella thermotolerans]